MKSSGKNISLTSYDDIFSSEEARTDAKREKIVEIPLSELFPFKDHPFKVLDDNRMLEITAANRIEKRMKKKNEDRTQEFL